MSVEERGPIKLLDVWLARPRLGALLAGSAAALLAVAVTSLAIGLLLTRAHIANLSMLYLVAVLAVAMRFGGGPAVLASVAAFLVFDWFFVEPIHTFTVGDPGEWLSLLLFLLVAVVTGHLTAVLRRRAQEAEAREREALALHSLGRALAAAKGLDEALNAVCRLLCQQARASGAAILLLGADGRLQPAASAGHAMDWDRDAEAIGEWALERGQRIGRGHSTRRASVGLRRFSRGSRKRPLTVFPMSRGGQRLGILALEQASGAGNPSAEEERLFSAAADQIALAIESARLREEALSAEVLRRTDQLKTSLLNSISHELRTPLATIKAAAESLDQREVSWDEEQRRAFVAGIKNEADRLDRLVTNLLDMSRIEGGALQPDKQLYPLDAVIDDVVRRLAPLLARHRVVVEVPEDLEPVPLDHVQIHQVLSNLLENAARYTPAGTAIRVSARPLGGEVEVSVADEGAGMPESVLSHVFDKFYRAPGRTERGSGLGLSVAKGLVEAHGGTIRAESAPGRGTAVRLTLPLTDRLTSVGTQAE